MNLTNTFARIRALFPRRPVNQVRFIDVNEHIRRDLGFYNMNSDRRVAERAPRTQEFIISGVITRAP
jgi:hypothetical protein